MRNRLVLLFFLLSVLAPTADAQQTGGSALSVRTLSTRCSTSAMIRAGIQAQASGAGRIRVVLTVYPAQCDPPSEVTASLSASTIDVGAPLLDAASGCTCRHVVEISGVPRGRYTLFALVDASRVRTEPLRVHTMVTVRRGAPPE